MCISDQAKTDPNSTPLGKLSPALRGDIVGDLLNMRPICEKKLEYWLMRRLTSNKPMILK